MSNEPIATSIVFSSSRRYSAGATPSWDVHAQQCVERGGEKKFIHLGSIRRIDGKEEWIDATDYGDGTMKEDHRKMAIELFDGGYLTVEEV